MKPTSCGTSPLPLSPGLARCKPSSCFQACSSVVRCSTNTEPRQVVLIAYRIDAVLIDSVFSACCQLALCMCSR